MNRISKFLLTSVFSLLLASSAFAAPAVTGVSGTLTHGSSVTITGTSFGTKSPAKPLIWADFETDLNPTNLGVETSWDAINNMALATDNQPSGSTQSARGDIYATTSVNFFLRYQYFDAAYASWKRMYNWTVSEQNMKFFRIYAVGSYPNFAMSWHSGGLSIVEGCDTTNWGITSGSPSANQWTNEEFVFQASSGLNVYDGIIKYYRDGALLHNITDLRTRCTTYPNELERLYTDNYRSGITPSPGDYIYMDDIYIDTTWARVMIGDASTWAAITNREIQPPSAWSTTSITVTLNQGKLVDLDGSWLYVMDANGDANSSGYLLSDAGCPTCPAAPTSFTIE